ncbi:hypothetical protein D037_3419B, partial [Vibrio parahaemolyticus IDH02640]
HNLEAPR